MQILILKGNLKVDHGWAPTDTSVVGSTPLEELVVDYGTLHWAGKLQHQNRLVAEVVAALVHARPRLRSTPLLAERAPEEALS